MSEVQANRPAVTDPLAQARREATAALFTMTFLQLGYAVLLAVLPRLLGATVDPAALALGLAWMAGLAALFAGLGVWARFQTLPAAVVGLGLIAVLAGLTVVSQAERIGFGTVVQLLVQLVLATLLVRAIRTCRKARHDGQPLR